MRGEEVGLFDRMSTGTEIDVICLEHDTSKLRIRVGVLCRQSSTGEYADLALGAFKSGGRSRERRRPGDCFQFTGLAIAYHRTG